MDSATRTTLQTAQQALLHVHKALLESLGSGLGLVDVDEAMPSDVDTPHALSELDARRRREDSGGAS